MKFEIAGPVENIVERFYRQIHGENVPVIESNEHFLNDKGRLELPF